MYIKLNTQNERLEWYKKRSLFAKWAMQNNSDALDCLFFSSEEIKYTFKNALNIAELLLSQKNVQLNKTFLVF